MRIIKFKEFIVSRKFKAGIIFLCTFIIIYLVMFTSLVTKKYSLQVGDISKTDIEAPREVLDQKSTNTAKSEAVNGVLPQYSKKTDVKSKIDNDINTFVAEILQIKDLNVDDKTKLSKLKSLSTINISDKDYGILLSSGKDDITTLQNYLLRTMNALYDSSYIEAKNDDRDYDNTKESDDSIKKAKDSLSNSFASDSDISKLSRDLKSTGLDFAYAEITPNSFYDKEKTEQLRKDATNKVTSVIIKKDQIILSKGEPVTEHQIEILRDLGLLNDNIKFNWYVSGSLGILIMLILILQWFYMYKYHEEIFEDLGKLTLINILNIIALILARSLNIISPFIIPLACIPMLLTLLIDYRLALTVSMLNCVLISQVVGFNPEITMLAIVNAVVGAVILRKMQKRNEIIYATIYISVINMILTFSVGLILSNNIVDVLKKSGLSLIGGIIASVLTIGFLPFFESTFDIVTTVKLLELSDPNNTLLKKLLVEAPGTYHHSILVANLAELASEAIGADTVLTRVSAYYHDIGKIKRPYFFKENQMGNDNPHDKITANLSTLIIISHVKDGLEMAKEYKVPKIIQDIIEQHHGTSLVKYFYLTVKNSSERPEEIKEENFRYPGPIPKSKEAGIIMLADAVEASVRSISDPTKGKIEEMVNNIIKERLNQGQLDNCDITLKDLDIIRKSFLQSLNGIYHKRIEYPTDKWENTK